MLTRRGTVTCFGRLFGRFFNSRMRPAGRSFAYGGLFRDAAAEATPGEAENLSKVAAQIVGRKRDARSSG